MKMSSVRCRVAVRSDVDSGEPYACVSAGGVVAGLREDNTYRIAIEAPVPCRLFVDDVELQRASDGCFIWSPGFFAGRVMAVAVEPSGREHAFYLDVSPAKEKLGAEQFEAMLSEIREFDAPLLLGDTPASIGFGRQGHSGRFDMLVRWARLKQHGPGFLAALHEISRMPHRFLRPATQELALTRVRRLPPSSLRDRRIASLVVGCSLDGEALESIRLQVHAPTVTADTPANRALLALLSRFRQTITVLEAWAKSSSGEAVEEYWDARRPRRLEILGQFAAAVDKLRTTFPFNEVTKAEITSAGLTQISAHPLYSRAHRKGIEALRSGVEGAVSNDLLQVSPSWGVYETWCFVRFHVVLERTLSIVLKPCRPSVASAELSMRGVLSDGRQLELLFQAVFPAEGPSSNRRAWSLSRERRPDIALVITEGAERRFILLDSKYRGGRTNVLDAMSSSHIYHDALRIDGRPPELCLLLLPGNAAMQSLEAPSFWKEHGVGTLSEFAIRSAGIDRCAELVGRWMHAPLTDGVSPSISESTDIA
jgi:hypothetical protein